MRSSMIAVSSAVLLVGEEAPRKKGLSGEQSTSPAAVWSETPSRQRKPQPARRRTPAEQDPSVYADSMTWRGGVVEAGG